LRRTALALALAAAVIVPIASTTVPALAADGRVETHHVSKPAKIVFTAAGTITAVDTTAGTLTVAAKGGTKDVRGKTVTIVAGPATSIRVGGVRKTLADLVSGERVAVVGVRQDTVYTAIRIDATATVKKTPSDDTTPEPTGSESRGS
jgi:hypothetical protein